MYSKISNRYVRVYAYMITLNDLKRKWHSSNVGKIKIVIGSSFLSPKMGYQEELTGIQACPMICMVGSIVHLVHGGHTIKIMAALTMDDV